MSRITNGFESTGFASTAGGLAVEARTQAARRTSNSAGNPAAAREVMASAVAQGPQRFQTSSIEDDTPADAAT